MLGEQGEKIDRTGSINRTCDELKESADKISVYVDIIDDMLWKDKSEISDQEIRVTLNEVAPIYHVLKQANEEHMI